VALKKERRLFEIDRQRDTQYGADTTVAYINGVNCILLVIHVNLIAIVVKTLRAF